MEIKKILVTTDLSGVSTNVFDLAAYEAKMKGAQIDLLHVLSPPAYYYPSYMEMGYESVVADYREQERASVKKKLEEFIKDKFHSVTVQLSILDYEASEGELIARHAKDNKCDTIMIASGGRGALGQIFVGSTVLRVLQHAHCPVIVVPAKKN